jgi:hypothetical protein
LDHGVCLSPGGHFRPQDTRRTQGDTPLDTPLVKAVKAVNVKAVKAVKAVKIADQLVAVGFFERPGSRTEPDHWIPLLFRPFTWFRD